MTMKVASPALTSVPTVVPRSVSLKNPSSPPRSGGATASLRGTSAASASTQVTLRSVAHAGFRGMGTPGPVPLRSLLPRPLVPAADSARSPGRGLSAQENVEQDGEDDADDDHRDDREVEATTFALDRDVARQPPERQPHAEHREAADDHQRDADDQENSPKFGTHRHTRSRRRRGRAGPMRPRVASGPDAAIRSP